MKPEDTDDDHRELRVANGKTSTHSCAWSTRTVEVRKRTGGLRGGGVQRAGAVKYRTDVTEPPWTVYKLVINVVKPVAITRQMFAAGEMDITTDSAAFTSPSKTFCA